MALSLGIKMIDYRAKVTLNDIIAAIPGFFLLFGYILALLIQYTQISNPITTTSLKARYEEREIGKIPKPHLLSEPQKDFEPVIKPVPELDSTGKPLLFPTSKTVTGIGKANIIVKKQEVLIPRLGKPKWQRKTSKRIIKELIGLPPFDPQVRHPTPTVLVWDYSPNITYEPTGSYEEIKEVNFIGGVNPAKFGLYGGLIGSVLSLVYFIFKVFSGLLASRFEKQ